MAYSQLKPFSLCFILHDKYSSSLAVYDEHFSFSSCSRMRREIWGNMGKAIEDGCEVFLKAVETLKATKSLRVIENDHEGQQTTSLGFVS